MCVSLLLVRLRQAESPRPPHKVLAGWDRLSPKCVFVIGSGYGSVGVHARTWGKVSTRARVYTCK